jgi:RimJ/RimL family protein N-acetyltransferase
MSNTHRMHADASAPTIKVNNKLGPKGTLNGRQSHFIDEYMSNGQNGAAAYRKAYRSKSSNLQCGQQAHELLRHPVVAQAVRSKIRMLELARQGRLEAQLAKFSVYVAREYRGRGAGKAVLTALMGAATAAGLYKLTSRVFPENIASRALLKGLGFAEIGIHRRHGKLDGVWRDCVIIERLLDTESAEDPG